MTFNSNIRSIKAVVVVLICLDFKHGLSVYYPAKTQLPFGHKGVKNLLKTFCDILLKLCSDISIV